MTISNQISVVLSLILYIQCKGYLVSLDQNASSVVENIEVTEKADMKNELDQLQFAISGNSYSFKLTHTNSLFSPNFKILYPNDFNDNENSDVNLDLQESESLKGSFYTDVNGRSSFYIQHDNGQIQMEGILDDSMRIWNSDGHHRASKISNMISDIDYGVNEDYASQISNATMFTHHDLATVEVLILLDQMVYRNLTNHKTSIKKYLGIFWNFVQTKYEVTSKPKVKFSLTGVVVLDDWKWISNSFIKHNVPDVDKMLRNLGQWLYKEKLKHPNYDAAVLHTGMDLAILRNNKLFNEIVGAATTTGVCKQDDFTRRMLKCTVIEDPNAPLYMGAFTAAHEMAHLLGSHHDNPKICTPDGIMAEIKPNLNPNLMSFSDCTLNAISKHLSSDQAFCLYNAPNSEIPILPEDPGMSRDEMCKLQFGKTGKAVSKQMYSAQKKDPCSVLLCYKGTGAFRSIRILHWVPEKTDCFDGNVCIRGKCVTQ